MWIKRRASVELSILQVRLNHNCSSAFESINVGQNRVYGADKLSHTKSYPTLTWRWIQTSNYTCTVVLNVGLNWSTESGTTIAQRMSLELVHDPTIHFFIRFIYPVDMFSHSFVRSLVPGFLRLFFCPFNHVFMFLFFACRVSISMMKSAAWILPLAFELVLYHTAVTSCPLKCSCKDTSMHCNMDDLRSLETMSDQNITNL